MCCNSKILSLIMQNQGSATVLVWLRANFRSSKVKNISCCPTPLWVKLHVQAGASRCSPKKFLCGWLIYFLAQYVLCWFFCLSAVKCRSDTAAQIYFMVLLGCISYLKAPLKVFIHLMDLWVIASKLCINRSKSVLYYSPAIVKYFPVPFPSAGLMSSLEWYVIRTLTSTQIRF